MAKSVDYSKIKALSQQIIECIGEDEEGENPSLSTPDVAIDDGGQVKNLEFLGNSQSREDQLGSGKSVDDVDKKKKKDSALAMMGAVLASKFNK